MLRLLPQRGRVGRRRPIFCHPRHKQQRGGGGQRRRGEGRGRRGGRGDLVEVELAERGLPRRRRRKVRENLGEEWKTGVNMAVRVVASSPVSQCSGRKFLGQEQTPKQERGELITSNQ